jgi:hypothetical protein
MTLNEAQIFNLVLGAPQVLVLAGLTLLVCLTLFLPRLPALQDAQ